MKDPVILITGAGKGIGRAVVLELCKRTPTPRLMLTARTEADLAELRAECGRHGIAVETLAADLAQQPTAALEKCVQVYGRVDTLIHCAGVGRFGELLELTAEDLDFVMGTNVRATFLLAQAAFAKMRAQGAGHMLLVSSVAAIRPFEQSAIYCMSKYAQRGLTEVLRLHARKAGVRVTEVLPGATLTPMWGPVDAAMKQRMMPVEDVARVIADALAPSAATVVEEIVVRPVGGDL